MKIRRIREKIKEILKKIDKKVKLQKNGKGKMGGKEKIREK